MAVRRGPRLIGTVARTAVVAGTATAVSGGVARRQQAKADSQQAAADEQAQRPTPRRRRRPEQQMQMTPDDSAAAGAGGISDAAMAKLEQLAELKKQGILTDEEFADQKAKILA